MEERPPVWRIAANKVNKQLRTADKVWSSRLGVGLDDDNKLDLVGVHKVRWDNGGTVRAGDYNFFCGKGTENHQMGTRFL